MEKSLLKTIKMVIKLLDELLYREDIIIEKSGIVCSSKKFRVRCK